MNNGAEVVRMRVSMMRRCAGPVVHVLLATAMFMASTNATSADEPQFSKGFHFDAQSGEAIYRSICQGCHMPDGQGAQGAGVYPKLAHDATLASPEYSIIVVLRGRKNMPRFGKVLDDAQIAAVVGYVRSHFGNSYGDNVTAEQVAALRGPQ
jgi:mono/diheme cytochrome c family protein